MFTAELTFECYRDTTIDDVNQGITELIDALRYNGQILGREFPSSMHDGLFVTRVVCPEEESLHAKHHSVPVKDCLKRLADYGLLAPKVRVTGMDLHSDNTDPCEHREWQVLYTHYLSTCSPVRCGEHLAPVPLYRLNTDGNTSLDYETVLRWQIDWSCADELQMHGATLADAAKAELTAIDSLLNEAGYLAAKEIEKQSKIPTYYYLYHLSEDENEPMRLCPSCQGDWQLNTELHGIFAYKCDPCRLVSNLPW